MTRKPAVKSFGNTYLPGNTNKKAAPSLPSGAAYNETVFQLN
jgi:hypothetical protein